MGFMIRHCASISSDGEWFPTRFAYTANDRANGRWGVLIDGMTHVFFLRRISQLAFGPPGFALARDSPLALKGRRNIDW